MSRSGSNRKRSFPRLRYDVNVNLGIGGEQFDGRLTDLSVDGLGVFLLDETSLYDRQVKVVINDLRVDATGKVIWSKRLSSGQHLGIALSGRLMGRLETWTLPDVLQGLHKRGETGTLKIVDTTGTRKIFLQDGEIVFASSGSDDEQMGKLLLMTGRITQEQLDRARNAAGKTGHAVGAVLVELGILSSADLVWAVQNQAEQNISHFMTLDQGAFVFVEGAIPRDEIIRLPLNTVEILYRSVRTSSDPARIRNCFAETDTVILAHDHEEISSSLSFNQQDREVLGLLSDSSRVGDILERSPLPEEETFRVLYALMSTGMIDVRGMPPEAAQKRQAAAEPVKEEPPAPDPKEIELEKKVQHLYQHHRALGYYGVLEVSHHTPVDEIKKAYHRMVKEYHPDRYPNLTSQDLKGKLNTVFAYINEAYSFLSKSGGTSRYQQEPVMPEAPPENDMERNAKMAAAKFEAGTMYYRKGNYSEASTLFGQAIYLDAKVPDYHFYYGAALRQMKKFKDAEESIKKALQLAPFNASYVSMLGDIYLQLGFKTRARHSFEKALKLDPTNKKAHEGILLCDQ